MKKILLAIVLPFYLSLSAQEKLDDFGRIVLNVYVPSDMPVPAEAKTFLTNKLNQIVTNNGIGGSQVNPRFIITASVNIGTKDIIAGPPQMIAQNLDFTIYVGDALANTMFSSVNLQLKGVGTNENKAFIEAFKTINVQNKAIAICLETGKSKIIEYYKTQCDFIIKDAQTLVKQQKYDEAIYKLSLVPEVCEDCYFKCLDTLTSIYQKKIDIDCAEKFKQAKVEWAASLNPAGAEKAGDILSTINPMASCQKEVDAFIKSIEDKLKADEKARWQFKMKQYADKIAAQKEQVRIAEEQSKRDALQQEKQSQRNFELDKMRVNSYREVAVEYARNQPKTVTYNTINWK